MMMVMKGFCEDLVGCNSWLSEAMGLQTFAFAPPADSQPASNSKSWRCGYCGFTTFEKPWVEKVAGASEVSWNQWPLKQKGFH